MSSNNVGKAIKLYRLRKQWTQNMLLNREKCEDRKLTKLENNGDKPGEDMLQSLVDVLEIPVNQFLSPYLEGQTMESYMVYDRIIFSLDSKDAKTAQKLIPRLERLCGLEENINLQVLISCKTRLAHLQHKDPLSIICDVRKGISITFPEFDETNLRSCFLVFEEIELLHTMARSYELLGNIQQAIEVLVFVKNSLVSLPKDVCYKEKKLALILKTLTKFLIKVENFRGALDLCDLGLSVSLKWSKGKEVPSFLYNKAYCLFKLGTPEDCYNLLMQSYFSYLLLRNKEEAELVRQNAYDIFGITIKTYDTEPMPFARDKDYFNLARGKIIKCTSLGNFIGILRVEANISQKELCQGVCSVSMLSRIESDQTRTTVYNLEVFMQRLGRDINLYMNTFLGERNFNMKQTRDLVHVLLSQCRGAEAEVLLNQIKNEKEFKKGVNLQFVKMAEASILFHKDRVYSKQYFNMVYEALTMTLPKFDEDMIRHYPLSFYEIILINKIALYFCESNELKRGLNIFRRVKESMDRTYLDETEKMRTYGTILYNYSKYLGLGEYYKEAMEIIEIGESLCVKHGRLVELPGYAVNTACNLLKLGKKEESLPYFAMSYYGSAAVRKIRNQEATNEHVKKELGIIFD